MEFMSPASDRQDNSYRRIKYPSTYKCDMEITAFSRDMKDEFSKLNKTSRFNNQLPSSITYKLQNAFPSSIVAAPLAYGKAELIKTSITFKYDQYFIDRTSRVGNIFSESRPFDRIVGNSPEEAAAIAEDTGRSLEFGETISSGGFVETVIE